MVRERLTIVNLTHLIKAAATGLLLNFTTGCAHFVEQQLLYPSDDSLIIKGVSEAELLEMHHLQPRTASGQKEFLFYFGDAETITSDYAPPNLDLNVRFANAAEDEEPVRKYRLQLEPVAETISRAKGIVILLHSYSTNAQSVLFDNTALQLQGYHTAVIDLLGHGRAKNQPVSFGNADVNRLHQLVTQLRQQYQLPVILYGKSYGASIAAQYIESHGGISGFIAVAPMTDFTPAAIRVAKISSPFFTELVSDQWLQETFENVLLDKQTNSRQLSTPHILLRQPSGSLPPTLVLTGEFDKISNPKQIKELARIDTVEIQNFDNRGHIEMMIFDNQINNTIKQWLKKLKTIKNPA